MANKNSAQMQQRRRDNSLVLSHHRKPNDSPRAPLSKELLLESLYKTSENPLRLLRVLDFEDDVWCIQKPNENKHIQLHDAPSCISNSDFGRRNVIPCFLYLHSPSCEASLRSWYRCLISVVFVTAYAFAFPYIYSNFGTVLANLSLYNLLLLVLSSLFVFLVRFVIFCMTQQKFQSILLQKLSLALAFFFIGVLQFYVYLKFEPYYSVQFIMLIIDILFTPAYYFRSPAMNFTLPSFLSRLGIRWFSLLLFCSLYIFVSEDSLSVISDFFPLPSRSLLICISTVFLVLLLGIFSLVNYMVKQHHGLWYMVITKTPSSTILREQIFYGIALALLDILPRIIACVWLSETHSTNLTAYLPFLLCFLCFLLVASHMSVRFTQYKSQFTANLVRCFISMSIHWGMHLSQDIRQRSINLRLVLLLLTYSLLVDLMRANFKVKTYLLQIPEQLSDN